MPDRIGDNVEEHLHEVAVDVVVRTLVEPEEVAEHDRRRYRALFHALIEHGQRTGVFASRVSGDLVADFYLGSVRSLGVWCRPEAEDAPASIGQHYARRLLEGLRADAVGAR
ncbi:hypothetical protein NI17_011245 [Thermobifida halotolerans]|uniref:HTH-type transcriptional repressor KstR2 C-terminal domain-containing protein n=1 Tax=Thermobifida halotolerans TaxID=483545 RepID=A0AA97M100_9ACTN|nr:hypothetical protein [Thermobifida halotolerans]UOE21616.1 hypothetical protein NI17_011245 [Thermobifida halotolerans]